MDVEAVLQSLTQEEKISLLAGADFSWTKGIPEKGVPAVRLVDGPNGVRSAAIDEDTHAACFPAGCSLAATFDLDIARRVGRALAVEVRRMKAHCLLGPTVCIHRHPLGGRNFESFGEDPFLTGKLASQYIQGLQSLGISATIKHFVANEQETHRTTVDESIGERALREIYLRPFEIAVKEAKPWAIMTAYNSVNGKHCDSNEWLLQQVLRREWGWKGLVMSDWGGTNSVGTALEVGLDLEMPGPPKVRKLRAVLEALEGGSVSPKVLDDRTRSVLEFVSHLKAREAADGGHASDSEEPQALIREAAAKGMVLLKNENNILPLTKEKSRGKRICLVGFSKDTLIHGGGSAAVNAPYKISPWEGLHAALGDSVEFTFAAGAHRERLLPPINKDGSSGTVTGLDGETGFSHLLSDGGKPVTVRHGQTLSAYSPLGSQESYYRTLEVVGDFVPKESGAHYMTCSGMGPSRLYINDELVFEQKDNCSDPMGSLFLAAPESEFRHAFSTDKTYRIRICSEPPIKLGLEMLEGRSGVRVGFSLESVHDADLQGEAVSAAEAADIALVFTGHDPQWETEGRDQDSFSLPRGQDELISAVATANKNTIVINSTGVAVAMPWLDQVRGVVQAWFPGQECGNAIADVLTGAINPEGHLPVTFPRRIEDAPAHGNFPGSYVDGQLKVTYAEGVFVGYRHFDRVERGKVNFPFGHGLSYSSFAFQQMKTSKQPGNRVMVSVDVENTGSVAGGTLVQVYAGKWEASTQNPIKSLVGFQKVRLQPGETINVDLRILAREFARYDEGLRQWVIDAGDYTISLGNSSADIFQTGIVQLDKAHWNP